MRPVSWSISYLLRCPLGISMVTSNSTTAPSGDVSRPCRDTSLATTTGRQRSAIGALPTQGRGRRVQQAPPEESAGSGSPAPFPSSTAADVPPEQAADAGSDRPPATAETPPDAGGPAASSPTLRPHAARAAARSATSSGKRP